MWGRKWPQLVLITICLVGYVFTGFAYAEARMTGSDSQFSVGDNVTNGNNYTTVISTQGTPSRHGILVAIGPDGTVRYANTSASSYWDNDPSPNGRETVVYSASYPVESCECYKNVIERANISTGKVVQLYSQTSDSGRWHDVDRIGPDRFAVADLSKDRVFIVNITSGLITWQWDAAGVYPPTAGGEFTGDWTHINDVEVLDGRLMISIRNFDRVVFVDLEDGVDESWTLGEEDNYQIVNQQHNPDYISEKNGGPAVLLADSENNRIVEYQRTNGTWTQSWMWTDQRMQWPRDADRLPNGNTLITDSSGNRVLEVSENGTVVWSVTIGNPYEAERLDTAPESRGGPAASTADLRSAQSATIRSTSIGNLIFPNIIITTLNFLAPSGLFWYHSLVFFIASIALLLTGVIELRQRFKIKIALRSR